MLLAEISGIVFFIINTDLFYVLVMGCNFPFYCLRKCRKTEGYPIIKAVKMTDILFKTAYSLLSCRSE
jgi:hypothetical protein